MIDIVIRSVSIEENNSDFVRKTLANSLPSMLTHINSSKDIQLEK